MVQVGQFRSINSWVRGIMTVRSVTPGIRLLRLIVICWYSVSCCLVLSVNCMSRFLGLDVVLGPTLSIECLSINLRISSLVIFIYLQDRYVEIHFWIDQTLFIFLVSTLVVVVPRWRYGGVGLVILISQGPTLWPDGIVEFSGWVMTWWTQFPKRAWVD